MELFIRQALILLAGFFSASLGQKVSDFLKCKVNDIEPFLPEIRISPCFKCYCSQESGNEVCSIRHETCERLTCFLQEYDPKKCCKQCKGCYFKEHFYKHDEIWRDYNDTCIIYQCKEGIVSNISPECIVNCSQPIKLAGECCSQCPGCYHKNILVKEGETVKDGSCRSCTCKNSLLECTEVRCPHLHCLNPVPSEGECCPKCDKVGTASYIHWKDHSCRLKGKQLENKKSFRVDKCTTCYCNEGTVICTPEVCKIDESCSKDQLITSKDQCCPTCSHRVSCFYMGKIYKNLEKWYMRGCVECHCVNGSNFCRKQVCPEILKCSFNYRPGYMPGSCCLQCIPVTSSCIGYGDPHYQTFDEKTFSYQGVCRYILAKDCTLAKSFSIVTQNHDRHTKRFSWIKSVTFLYLGVTISLLQNYKVKINGKFIRTPYANLPYVDIRKSNRYIYVYTNDGITLKWDGDDYIQVDLPLKYKSNVCGLCGNFNGNPSDDFLLPNGVLLSEADQFGDFWRRSKTCTRKPRVVESAHQLTDCVGSKLLQSHKSCSEIFFDKSIEKCKRFVSSAVYFQDCVSDMCHCPFKKQHCECGAVRSYFERCLKAFPNLKWVHKDKCDASCSGGSEYAICASPCQSSCDKSHKTCHQKECAPGCQCPAGFTWHNDQCIVQDKCP